MFSWIRWWGLIVFVVIFGGGTVFFLLAAGPLAKLSIEKIGTMVNGALVEVDSASVTFNPLGLKVTGLQVTDEAQPMRNVLEVKQAVAELELAPLLIGKGIIRELSVDGMVFDTARKTSGAVIKAKKEKKEDEKSITETIMSSVDLPSAKDILANEQLTTDGAGKAFKDSYENNKEQIDKKLDAVPDDSALKAYENEIKAITGGKIESLQDFNQRKAQLDELKQRFKQDQAAIAEAREAVKTGREEISTALKELKAAPGKDLASIRNKYQLNAGGASNLTATLFGSEAGDMAAKTLYWYEKVKPYLASSDDEAVEVKKEVKRERVGRYIHFPTNDPWPSALLRHSFITASIPAGNIGIEAKDLTHQPKVLGRPALVNVNSTALKNIDTLKANLVFDHTKSPGKDSLSLRISNWQPDDFKLGMGDIKLTSAKVQIKADASVSRGNLVAQGVADFAQTGFVGGGKTFVAKELGLALANIKQFNIEAEAQGKVIKPKVSISSNLDTQLSKAFSQRLKAKQDELEQQLKQELNARLESALGEHANVLAELNSVEGGLDAKLDKLKSMASSELTDFKEQQKQEAKEKAAEEKDELKSKAKDKLKKLF